jgi:hypothetical protein
MIRKRRFYRRGFKNFKDYCADRWGMGKAHAARLITGSQVAVNLMQECNVMPHGTTLPACEIQPTSEYQIRPLAILNPEQQCEVWKEAVRTADGKVVTYQQVKALVAELIGPAPSALTSKKARRPEPFSDRTNGFSGRTTSKSSVSMRSNGMRRYRGGK